MEQLPEDMLVYFMTMLGTDFYYMDFRYYSGCKTMHSASDALDWPTVTLKRTNKALYKAFQRAYKEWNVKRSASASVLTRI